MDIDFVKKYLHENLGFSDEKIDKISKFIDLLLIFNKTCSNNVLSPSFVWFLSSPNLFDFPPASTTAKILLSSINENIKH